MNVYMITHFGKFIEINGDYMNVEFKWLLVLVMNKYI